LGVPPYDNRFRTWYAGQFAGGGGNPACGGPNGGAGAAITSGGGPEWVARSCCNPGICLIRFCALLPPPEDDPPEPAEPIDEPGDVVAAPAIAEDAAMPGDVVATELPGKTGGATELMPAPDLATADSESLVAD